MTTPLYHDPHTSTSYDRLPSHVRRTIPDADGNPAEVRRPVTEGQLWGILERVDATPPDGRRILASHGELQGDPAQWVEVIDAEVEILPEAQANRIAAITAECESRFAARWPETDRTLSVAGVPLEPASPEAIDDAIAHQEARDVALILVEAATDAAGVAAVTVEWP